MQTIEAKNGHRVDTMEIIIVGNYKGFKLYYYNVAGNSFLWQADGTGNLSDCCVVSRDLSRVLKNCNYIINKRKKLAANKGE